MGAQTHTRMHMARAHTQRFPEEMRRNLISPALTPKFPYNPGQVRVSEGGRDREVSEWQGGGERGRRERVREREHASDKENKCVSVVICAYLCHAGEL